MNKKWHYLIGVIVILFVLSSLSLAKRNKWTVVEPMAGNKVSIDISGQKSEYCILEKSNSVELKIEGPTKLKIISRLNFPPGASGSAQYALEIKENHQIIKSYSTTSSPSSEVSKIHIGLPGKSRKFTLDVPEGVHRYNVQLSNTPSQVLLRFLIQSSLGKSSWVSMTPIEYDKVVVAILKEKPVSFYTCSAEKPVRLKIIGPTRLRVVTRLNYESNMKGKQKYLLLVEENGKLIHKQALESTKSLSLTYKDLKTVVPGQSETLYIEVPSGQHLYSFRLGESLAKSLSLRFLMPEKDLKNGG